MITILSYSAETGLREWKAEDLDRLLKDESLLKWIDLDGPTEEEARILSDVFKFHPLAVEDCLGFVPNPKIDDYGDYLYIVIHGMNAEALKKDELKTHDLDIFLGRNWLVTFHKGRFRSVASAMERCRKNPAFMGKSPDMLMHRVIDALIDNYLPLIDGLGGKIDETEKEIFTRPRKTTVKRLLALKKDVTYLRRILNPQREMIRRLTGGEYRQISPDCALHFRDVHDHIFMTSELIETYRDNISGAMDVHLTLISNRLSEIMKVLTVIATIMMPLTLITGIYGMNFEEMPLLDSPYGFSLVVAVMACLGAAMLFFFKRRGWW